MSLDAMYLVTVFVVAPIAGAGWAIGQKIVAILWR